MITHKYLISQPEIAKAVGVKPQAIAMQASRLGISGTTAGNRTNFSPFAVRSIMEGRGFKYPKLVLSFQMLKGGSTKTSSAFNLAVRLNQYGARVLVIDADPQGNMTRALNQEHLESPIVLAHILNEENTIQEAIIPVNESLDLVPSSYDNSMIDLVMSRANANLKKVIADIIAPLRAKYDFIIFDCNPALSAFNISIALASDQVVIPVNPDPFSKQGLEMVIKEFQRLGKSYEKDIDYRLLFTLYDGREPKISQKYMFEYGSQYEERMFTTFIKRSVDVKTAVDQHKTIFDFKTASARADFDAFALEVLQFNVKEAEIGNA